MLANYPKIGLYDVSYKKSFSTFAFYGSEFDSILTYTLVHRYVESFSWWLVGRNGIISQIIPNQGKSNLPKYCMIILKRKCMQSCVHVKMLIHEVFSLALRIQSWITGCFFTVLLILLEIGNFLATKCPIRTRIIFDMNTLYLALFNIRIQENYSSDIVCCT